RFDRSDVELRQPLVALPRWGDQLGHLAAFFPITRAQDQHDPRPAGIKSRHGCYSRGELTRIADNRNHDCAGSSRGAVGLASLDPPYACAIRFATIITV